MSPEELTNWLFDNITKINFTTQENLDNFIIALVKDENKILTLAYYYTTLSNKLQDNNEYKTLMRKCSNSQQRNRFTSHIILTVITKEIDIYKFIIDDISAINSIYNIPDKDIHKEYLYKEYLAFIAKISNLEQIYKD